MKTKIVSNQVRFQAIVLKLKMRENKRERGNRKEEGSTLQVKEEQLIVHNTANQKPLAYTPEVNTV